MCCVLQEILSTITHMFSGNVVFFTRMDVRHVPPNPPSSGVPVQDFEVLSSISKLSLLLVSGVPAQGQDLSFCM